MRTRKEKVGDECSHEAVIWLQKQGMDLLDGFYVMAYTGSSSSWLNIEKRNNQDYKYACKAAFAERLEAALMKITPFKVTVYRMEQADDEGVKSVRFTQILEGASSYHTFFPQQLKTTTIVLWSG